jgi:hypothetical protein
MFKKDMHTPSSQHERKASTSDTMLPSRIARRITDKNLAAVAASR